MFGCSESSGLDESLCLCAFDLLSVLSILAILQHAKVRLGSKLRLVCAIGLSFVRARILGPPKILDIFRLGEIFYTLS